ncbi:Trihelix transcription factor [Nymphaea thermarum]|nr:Trihelix transcription factor [Nymphaea thermarum]
MTDRLDSEEEVRKGGRWSAMMDPEMEALAMGLLQPVRLVPAEYSGDDFHAAVATSSSAVELQGRRIGPPTTQRTDDIASARAAPQWSHQETRDFIAIRAELERDFTQAKRNKTLWEAVAARMAEMGYRRTPEQCKCKWKNLVNRYKPLSSISLLSRNFYRLEDSCSNQLSLHARQGKETSDPDEGRQCPFFDELHKIFTERAKNMQRLLLESELRDTISKKKMKRPQQERFSDDLSQNPDEDEEDSDEESIARKSKRSKAYGDKAGVTLDKSKQTTLEGILQSFFQQQHMLDLQWQQMMDRRAQERHLSEQEWRKSMEKLERDRLIMEQTWREKEEQRRIREETRAEKRDALLTALLKKLINDF